MQILSISLVLSLLGLAVAQDTSLGEVKRAFDNAKIPADASLVFNPTTLLEVTFAQASGPAVRVKAGVQLPRNKTAIPPTFSIATPSGGRRPAGAFVVAMVDLDAPTPQAPSVAQIRHFLGGDFTAQRPAHDLALLANATPAVSPFRQPTPPAGSDPHRYVFLLFAQPAGFDQQTVVTASTPISLFNISLFASEVGLGNPLGGSFILVGPDPPAA